MQERYSIQAKHITKIEKYRQGQGEERGEEGKVGKVCGRSHMTKNLTDAVRGLRCSTVDGLFRPTPVGLL